MGLSCHLLSASLERGERGAVSEGVQPFNTVKAAAGCLDKSLFPWQPAPSDGKGNVPGPVIKWHLGMSWASDEDDG